MKPFKLLNNEPPTIEQLSENPYEYMDREQLISTIISFEEHIGKLLQEIRELKDEEF